MSAEQVKRSQYFNPPSTECRIRAATISRTGRISSAHGPDASCRPARPGCGQRARGERQEAGAQIEVGPGVAVNRQGELIALSAEGQADIGSDLPGEAGQQIAAPFRLGTAGRESGSHYLCIQFAQALRFTEGSCGKLEQTPWLRLLPTAAISARSRRARRSSWRSSR